VLEKFLQTLMDGLAVGSLYALIALGYTMVYGILKFINFAHSDIFVLGAWTAYVAALSAGWSVGEAAPIAGWLLYALGGVAAVAVIEIGVRLVRKQRPLAGVGGTLSLVAVWGWSTLGLVFVARFLRGQGLEVVAGLVILVVSMLACGLVGFCLERLAYKPLRKAPRLNVLITAIGVSLLLQNLGQLDWMFGTRPQRMPTLLPDRVLLEIGGGPGVDGGTPVSPVQVRLLDVLAAGMAVVLMVALDRLVFHTKLGRAMRAVSFNTNTASLMGIPVDKVISFTFVLGAMLAAAAGFLYAQKYPGLNQPAAAGWVLLGLKAFVAAVVGGIGNIRGAMLGGVLIGLLEFFGVAYISPELRDLYVFSVLIVVLLVRPGGILGRAGVEKV